MKRVGLVVMPFLIAGPVLGAQAPSAVEAKFDVVSIRLSDPASRSSEFGNFQGGHWKARNATLETLIAHGAFPDYRSPGRVVGGPSWMRTTGFDVEATTT